MKTYIQILLLSLVGIISLQCDKNSVESSNFGGTTGTGGSMARFTIAGNYLYTVDQENLKVYSIQAAGNPVLKNTVAAGFEIETIYPLGDKLFIGSTSVIHIFSIADPENPQKLSTAISPTVMRRCDPVVAKDNVAYATLRTNGPCGGIQSVLAVFDITNIQNPVQRTSIPVTEPYGLGYTGNTLYVCERYGLWVYDISNPFAPQQVGTVGQGNWFIDVIPYGQTLICWTSEGVILFNITNDRSPQFIAKII